MSATPLGGLSTFLLEMALDKARMKGRLAAVLQDERRIRGRGDARRFPQPEMARLLGYSLRQYQRLEDPDDGSLPTWDALTEILTKLERPQSDIFGEEETDEQPAEEPAVSPDRPAAAGAEEARDLRVLVDALLRDRGLDPEQILRDARLPPEEPEPGAEDREAPGEAASAA
jgi:transcriptional regulator with XRE-family HTH domain